MADRSVLVRLVAENGSFDAAMSTSGKRVEGIGESASKAAKVARSAFDQIKIAGAGLLGIAALKSGQDLINLQQSAQVAFTSITGDATKASAAIQQIYEWDQNISIPFQNALASGRKLAAFGLDLKDVVPTLQAIADATGAVGGGADVFDRIALALGQIQTKGKLSGEEILQLAEAGLPAWDILADQLGITIPAAMKLTQKGAIDADTAITALREGIEKRFPGAAKMLQDTTLGAFGSLKAGIRDGAKAILDPLQDIAKQSAKTGGALVRNLGTGIGGVMQGLTPILSGVTSALGGVAGAAKGLGPAFSAAGLAMLGTHLAAGKLTSAGQSLGIKALYMTDTFGRFGDQMKVQQSLAAMSGQSLSRMGAAASVTGMRMRALGTSVAGAGSKLMGAFGGPLGIAIIGATTLMSMWGNAQQKAKAKEEAHRAELSALKDTLDKVSGALTGATTAKIAQDWVKSGDIDKMEKLGINTHLAMDAITKGGPAIGAFHQQFVQALTDAITSSDEFGSKVVENLNNTGRTAVSIAEQTASGMLVMSTGSREVDEMLGRYAAVAMQVNQTQADLTQGTKEQRQAFDLVAASVATAANVSKDQLVPALDAAKASGGSVEDALKSAGFTTAQTATIIQQLSEYVVDSGQGFHVMAGAAGAASSALTVVGGSAKDAAAQIKEAMDKLDAMWKKANAVVANMAQRGLELRQSVQGGLTSFIDPINAWGKAVDAVNQKTIKPKGGVGADPSVKAAEAAVKAGKRRKDSTDKSAKDEKDAAVKAAQAIRDGIVDRAKSDAKATKDALSNAQKRADADRKEADELKKLADQRRKDADDSEDALNAANFRLRATEIAKAAASAGLAGATSPLERASWQRAYNSAVGDEVTAKGDAARAQTDYDSKTKTAKVTQDKSTTASQESTKADADLAAQKDITAKAAESASQRQQDADKALADAREKADARYQKAVDASTAMLQALQDAQSATRDSASSMASGSADAVTGMVAKIKPSFADFMTTLSDQKQAQDDWAQNLRDLAKKLGGENGDVVKYLAGLGPGAADMVAAMNTASVDELGKAVPLLRRAMPDWTDAITNGILAGIPGSESSAAQLGTATLNSLMNELGKTAVPTQDILDKFGLQLQNDADGKPIFMRIDADTSAADATVRTWAQENQHRFLGFVGAGSFSTPDHRAKGGNVRDGWTWYGENGPELGYKSGSSTFIHTAPQSAAMAQPAPTSGGYSGPKTVVYSTNYYPQAEPTSVATNRDLQTAASLDGIG